jgi:predicted esterase
MRFIPSLLIAFVVGCLASCQQKTLPETNELALEPSPELELIGPEEGFEYPFVLRYPESGSNVTPFLIVEPNNTGTVADDLNTHLESAMSLARGRPVGGFVAKYLNAPLLVPVFPRPKSDWHLYTHALDRDTMLISEGKMKRIDQQLLAMIAYAREKLSSRGLVVSEKSLFNGFSASGTFVNRFTAMYPEYVHAVAAGGINAVAIVPMQNLEGHLLNYPIGINDLQSITGREFQRAQWIEVPQFLYMGADDTNDAVSFDDGYSESERLVVHQTLGAVMLPNRWQTVQDTYESVGANVVFKTYDGIGHGTNRTINTDVAEFFRSTIPD